MAPPRSLTPEQELDLFNDCTIGGMTPQQAANFYGITVTTARRIVKRVDRLKKGADRQRYANGRVVALNRIPKKKFMPCGTNAAHSRHLRKKEIPCQKCCDAHAAYTRKRRAESKKKFASESTVTSIPSTPEESCTTIPLMAG